METEEEESGGDVEILHKEGDVDKSLEPAIIRRINQMIKENEKRLPEKRKERESEISDDDDFITVDRRRPKRLSRSLSVEIQNDKRVDEEKDSGINNTIRHEVCVTSLESIPKQMALAKLLRSENIKNVTRIKYKSFNKVLIQFNEKNDAIKLLDCQKFKDMGCRCQLIDELSLSYGVVKGVDLDLTETELLDIFECSTKVISVKRLRRVDSEGKWVNSESVRICFNNNNLPDFVYAYDCRFKVEPYVFPVTQCSGCWQFGHIMKYCPTKKKICPKCGGKHDNCDPIKISCLNCKGNHFVLDKSCPFFLKEKNIRKIMSIKQVTYRKALQLFMQQQHDTIGFHNNSKTSIETNLTNESETFSSVLKKSLNKQSANLNSPVIRDESVRQKEASQQQEEPSQFISFSNINNNKERKTTKKKQNKHDTAIVEDPVYFSSQNEEPSYQRDEQLTYKFEFKKFLIKLNKAFVSEGTFEDKILLLFKIICEELKKIVVSCFMKGNFLDTFFSFLNG